jgi:hypothetical protein
LYFYPTISEGASRNKSLKKTPFFNIFKKVKEGKERVNRGTSVENEGFEILHSSPLSPATKRKIGKGH